VSHSRSTKQAKVQWLVQHREVWRDWPASANLIERRIMLGLQEAGLVSKHTNLYGIMDVGKLIAEAKVKIHNTRL